MTPEITKKKDRGVAIEQLRYIVDERSWPIRQDGHLPKHADKIAQAVKVFEDVAQKVADKKMETSKGVEIAKKVNRTILENALEPKCPEFPDGFDFDEVCNEYGWQTVEEMVLDLKLFLVELGGKEKYQLLKEYKKMEPEFDFIYPIITPPDSWKLKSDGSEIVLDADWASGVMQTLEEPYEMYVYGVEGFPELIKVGISKDSKKRLEPYYGELLWQKSFDKRTASMVEYLFKSSTYHRAHSSPPPWNIGNFFYDTALHDLKNFFDSVGHDSSGITEVRQMTVNEAKHTINYINGILINKDIFEAISRFGIKTFNGNPGIRGTITVERGQTWN